MMLPHGHPSFAMAPPFAGFLLPHDYRTSSQ
jgi:hypothetical protein